LSRQADAGKNSRSYDAEGLLCKPNGATATPALRSNLRQELEPLRSVAISEPAVVCASSRSCRPCGTHSGYWRRMRTGWLPAFRAQASESCGLLLPGNRSSYQAVTRYQSAHRARVVGNITVASMAVRALRPSATGREQLDGQGRPLKTRARAGRARGRPSPPLQRDSIQLSRIISKPP
jgi:hypothetical protein